MLVVAQPPKAPPIKTQPPSVLRTSEGQMEKHLLESKVWSGSSHCAKVKRPTRVRLLCGALLPGPAVLSSSQAPVLPSPGERHFLTLLQRALASSLLTLTQPSSRHPFWESVDPPENPSYPSQTLCPALPWEHSLFSITQDIITSPRFCIST